MRTLRNISILIPVLFLALLGTSVHQALAESAGAEPAEEVQQQKQPRFSMSAVDTPTGYVYVQLNPGDTHEVRFEIRNSGDGTGVAEVYTADAFTLSNGGFGSLDLNDPRTGTTRWLDLQSEAIELYPGEVVERTVTITVPDDAEPGEHLTSMVIQNQEPMPLSGEDSGIQLNQIARHAISVMIDVPGPRSPALEIGSAEHYHAGHDSAARVEVNNVGNERLNLTGEFRMEDAAGNELMRRDVSMKVIYAGHESHVRVTFGQALEPGDYWVWLTLEDEERGVSASGDGLLLNVPEPPERPESEQDSGVAGMIQPPRMPGDGGSGSWLTLLGILLAVAAAAAIGAMVGGQRGGGKAVTAGATSAAMAAPGSPSESHESSSAGIDTRAAEPAKPETQVRQRMMQLRPKQ